MHDLYRFRIRRRLAILLFVMALPVWCQEPVDWPGEVRAWVASQQIDRAMRTTEEWIRNYPDDLDAKAWHARILGWQGHSNQSEAEYRALLVKMPDDPDLLLELARLCNSRNRNREALELLDRAVRTAPGRADCRLEKARTLVRVGRRREARALYLELAMNGSVSKQSKTALQDMREEGRHRILVGGNADWISYAGDGRAFSAGLDSRWSRRWSTAASITRYARFGKSATGMEGSSTYRPSASDAITVGGASAGQAGIAPRAQAQIGYGHGFRYPSGVVRGLELTYDHKWVWYRDVRIVNFAPAAMVYFSKNWNCLLGVSTARIVLEGGKPSWYRSAQTRLVFPLHRRYTGQAIFSTGAENFGTLDQVLFRASRTAGGGLRIHVAPGQEIGTLVAYQRIDGGRSQISTGISYAVRF